MHLVFLISTWLALTFVSADFETAYREYQDTVVPLLTEGKLSAADVEPVAAVVNGLVETGRNEVFERLTVDAKTLAGRVADVTEKVIKKERELASKNEKLADLLGDARERAEEDIQEITQELTDLRELKGPLETLREAVFLGLLDISDKGAAVDPAATFDTLASYFGEDNRDWFDLGHKISNIEARLTTVANRILAAPADEKDALLKEQAELQGKLQLRTDSRKRLGQLKDRRVAALARIYPNLDKGKQSDVWNDIRRHLRDELDWEGRALYAELASYLPIDGLVGELVPVLKKASKSRRDLEKDLGPLREKYDRALKQYQMSVKGGKGTVLTSVVNTEAKARGDLEDAGRRVFGEGVVVRAASKALGVAIDRLGEADRKEEITGLIASATKEGDPTVRLAYVEALGYVESDAATAGLIEIARGGKELEDRLMAIDALMELKAPALVELSIGELLRDREWRVRSAAMRVLVEIPRKESIPALIASLGAEVGRLVDDAENALARLTGRSFNGEVAMWKDWWGKNKETFQVGAGSDEADGGVASTGPAVGRGSVSFYGIQTRSQRILFVLDRSGSMAEPISDTLTGKEGGLRKIDAAIAQLSSAIAALPEGAVFNIVTYASDVTRWQKRMQTMSSSIRKKVTKYIEKDIDADGGTNTHDALMEAFRLAGIGAIDRAYESNVDTIFFLSDGQPTNGEVRDPEAILARVREWNRISRIVLHTVGVGKGHDAAFMRRLASENGGQYTSR